VSEAGLAEPNPNLFCTCFSILSHQAFANITPLILQVYISIIVGNRERTELIVLLGTSWGKKQTPGALKIFSLNFGYTERTCKGLTILPDLATEAS